MSNSTSPRPQRSPKNNEFEGGLLIPVSGNRFGEFVSSLLGEPRSTEKTYNEPFKIDKDYIRSLADVISQRVNTQQVANLVNFSSKVFYEDGKVQTETTENSFFDLNDFHSSRPIKIALSWTYLVQFPKSDFPEKQVISFDVDKNIANNTTRIRSKEGWFARSVRNLGDIDLEPQIDVRIDYTEFTWGTDILRHIDDQLIRCIRPESTVKRGLQQLTSKTLPIVAATTLMMVMMSSVLLQINSLEEVPVEEFLANPLLTGTFEQQVNVKLDFLVGKTKAARAISSISLFATIASGFLAVLILFLFSKEQLRSHILLNQVANQYFEKSEKYLSNSKVAKTIALLVAIGVGILGNFGTDAIKKFLGIS
jgi:hypothetical protein